MIRVVWTAWLMGLIGAAPVQASEEWFDALDRALTVASADGVLRARVSGTLDVEGYAFSSPAPAFLQTDSERLLSPRLAVFLDAQAGSRVYLFAQARVDRGFDPTDSLVHGRIDELAVRITPWDDGRCSVQIGKFGTVFGGWVPRHDSWTNPFITAPLVYENLTGVWDAAPARSVPQLLGWAFVLPGAEGARDQEKQLRLPLIWGPSYATGASITGRVGRWDYAAEVKNASLASRPQVWSPDESKWAHPTVSGRLAFRPDAAWTLGVSASRGAYLRPGVTVPAGRRFGDYAQTLVGSDIGFAWRHWQWWAEWIHSRYAIPGVATVRSEAAYLEAKYKFTPRFAGALRLNRQVFSTVDAGTSGRLAWGRNLWRLDLAPTFRFTPHVQLTTQYSWQHADRGAARQTHLVAARLTVRF